MDVDKLISELLADLKANRINLPTLPQVAIKINDAIDSPDATAKSVAKVIGTDLALSARLIQVANSPMVRGTQPAENIQAAVTRMGLRMVRDLVTSFMVRQLFHTKYPELRQRMAVLWNHSAHVAAISYVLASRFSKLRPEEAMLAGLVHDIGKLPILAKAENMPGLISHPIALDKICERLHTTIGKVITQSWHFSPDLVAAVAEHEDVERNSKRLDYADVVAVANLHSYVGKDNHRLEKVNWGRIPAFRKLTLDPDTSIQVLEEAHEEISEIQKLIGGD